MGVELILRRRLNKAGRLLLLLGLFGYAASYLNVFNPEATPFLWFDPVKNGFHLVVGLILAGVAYAPLLHPAILTSYRPLLVLTGVLFVVVALLGFAVAANPSPNVLGITTLLNPFDNVIHWVFGFNCLTAAWWVPQPRWLEPWATGGAPLSESGE